MSFWWGRELLTSQKLGAANILACVLIFDAVRPFSAELLPYARICSIILFPGGGEGYGGGREQVEGGRGGDSAAGGKVLRSRAHTTAVLLYCCTPLLPLLDYFFCPGCRGTHRG